MVLIGGGSRMVAMSGGGGGVVGMDVMVVFVNGQKRERG